MAGDSLAQLAVSPSLDTSRLAVMTGFGLCLVGPVCHVWQVDRTRVHHHWIDPLLAAPALFFPCRVSLVFLCNHLPSQRKELIKETVFSCMIPHHPTRRYQQLDRTVFPSDSESPKAILAKTLLDQFLFSPLFTAVLLLWLAFFRGDLGAGLPGELGATLVETTVAGSAFWVRITNRE